MPCGVPGHPFGGRVSFGVSLSSRSFAEPFHSAVICLMISMHATSLSAIPLGGHQRLLGVVLEGFGLRHLVEGQHDTSEVGHARQVLALDARQHR